MAANEIQFAKNVSLNEALAMLEEDEEMVGRVENITMLPPINACGNLTDEDSGEEDQMSINNLPGSQLQATVELFGDHVSSSYDTDDNIPLSELARKFQNKKKNVQKKENLSFYKK
nr:piggyBac transposable element-derived protein 3-like [Onthophagus taurus]